MGKKIRSNAHRQIDRIFKDAERAMVFTLDEHFVGRDVDVKYAREALKDGSSYLRDDGGGVHTVHVHSNLWYRLFND
ncbi:hypothetical protein LCGC14_0516990 [marine sediment metagenome]|uniref:Uncharacterized protein n=1 Tax=marine sediment metagenome TaxID=412755 RepID=A0A0F9RZN6_9ZZZZ